MPNIKENILSSLTKVLQTIALTSDVQEVDSVDLEGEYSLVYISFSGDNLSGLMYQCFPCEYLRQLSDAIGVGSISNNVESKLNLEVINMVVGNFLTENYGFDCEIDLGIPSVGEFDPSKIDKEASYFSVNNQFMVCSWLKEGVVNEVN